MNLFSQPQPTVDPAQIQQIKTWVRSHLHLSDEIPLSISQLRCTEPGCPPIETVISVMTQPIQTYKIHQAAADLTEADIIPVLSQ